MSNNYSSETTTGSNRPMTTYYSSESLGIQLLKITFQIFELAGQSTKTTYSRLFYDLPEYLQREIKSKNGFYRKLINIIFPSTSANSNSIYIKSVSLQQQQQQQEPVTIDTPLNSTFVTSPISTASSSSSPMYNVSSTTSTSTSTSSPSLNNTTININTAGGAPVQSQEKINSLESELTRLREEFAKIMAAKNAANSSTASTTTPPPSSSVPPPPPPPPPLAQTKKLEIKKSINNSANTNNNSTPMKQPILSMNDILKGGKSLKRSDVVRSPGGTPLKDTTTSSNPVVSHQDFIANALKKKFQNTYSSPDHKSAANHDDDDSFSFDSDDDTSKTPKKSLFVR
ncbi:hypothetical protein CYY_003028 [Polysphondylium violaceum]|uniref:Uncharacterized protein n=1 Tax=Polysphondylium violaceum TaxID=133409 RepID=A0A8J4PXT8_9MYCE|nr:hypothetical protein CYY_003028 [Polysphondylium violaceum]